MLPISLSSKADQDLEEWEIRVFVKPHLIFRNDVACLNYPCVFNVYVQGSSEFEIV